MDIDVYHNPKCSKSRQVLSIIRESGYEPRIIEYLVTPPDRETLVSLIRRMGVGARDIVRRKGTLFDELGLADPRLSDEQLIDAMVAHPILIERPIVSTPRGAKLCRPPETVRELLALG